MKKKAIAIAVASALVTPASLAATDTGGMQYTSAAEGFYGSLRVRIQSGANTYSGSNVQNSGSRVGIQGSHDLGRGLSGSYRWEISTPTASGGDLSTRLGYVGLQGDFGQLTAGQFWTFSYNNVTSATDQANANSGHFQGGLSQGRASKSIQYTTPDFNGFQSALLLRINDSGKAAVARSATLVCQPNAGGAATAPSGGANCPSGSTPIVGNNSAAAVDDGSDIDQWNIAGAYSIQGFTFGAQYNTWTDALGSGTMLEDKKAWAIRGSYSQDNWVVNMIYGADNSSDNPANTTDEDVDILEFHGGVDINKTSLYGVYGARNDKAKQEDTFTTLGVVYRFTGKSRAWLEYAGVDFASDTTADSYVNAGLRFDF